MTERPILPEFSRPPVIEVAFGVQFDPVPGFGVPTQAKVWKALNTPTERFPTWEERPPLNSVFEVFGVPSVHQRMIVQFVGPAEPPNRAFFIDAEKTELIQLQNDRFMRNWRRIPHTEQYPRYEALRERFFDNYAEISKVLGTEVRPNQCELTYVNDIPFNGTNVTAIKDVLSVAPKTNGGDFIGTAERSQVSCSYVIRHEQKPLGRFHFSADDSSGTIRLTLTARGEPRGGGAEGVRQFLDIGREWIVRGFAALTTPQMHTEWGRTR